MKLKELLLHKPKRVENGIYFFARKKFYWNQIPIEKMRKMLDNAKNKGWLSALEETLLPLSNEYTFNYAIKEARGDWHFLTPVSSKSKVLDLGCGWGASTMALARNYSYVCAADSTVETLKFLKIRADQEGLKNIDFAVLDPLDYGKLPFKDNSYDLVVLNGVLEWTGTEDKDSNPRDIQLRALKEIRRVLKPDGVLYTGIENRFAATYFLGTKDHSEVVFTSLLPRSLANLVMRFVKRSEYRTYTYSYWGYKKLFKEAGFTNIKIYYPLPTYREPYSMVDSDDRGKLKIVKKYLRSPLRSILLNILYYFRLEKLFIHSFSLVTSESNALRQKDFFTKLFKENRNKLSIKDEIDDLRIIKIRSKIENNAAVTFFVLKGSDHTPSFLIKMPRNPQVKKYIEKEYRNCKRAKLLTKKDKKLNRVIMSPEVYDKDLGTLIFKVAKGQKISTIINRYNYDHNMNLMVSWLNRFQKETQKKYVKGREIYKSHLSIEVEKFTKIKEIKKLIPEAFKEKILFLEKKIVNNKNLEISVCAMHGDYNPYNIFINRNTVEVIDWEDFEEERLCIYDIFHLLYVTNKVILNRELMFDDKYFREFSKKLNISTEELHDFYLFYLIRFINNEYYSETRQDLFNKSVSVVLESMKNYMSDSQI